MKLINYISFIKQFLAVLVNKGNSYLVIIYLYFSSSNVDLTEFFIINSIGSFLSPVLLVGTSSVITKLRVSRKNKQSEFYSSILFGFLITLGVFSFTLTFITSFFLVRGILLGVSFAIFEIFFSYSRALDSYDNLKVSIIKSFTYFLSIFLVGVYSFEKLVFVLSLILIFIYQYRVLFRFDIFLNLFIRNYQLLYHSFSRWIMNSGDKLVLLIADFDSRDQYTLIYTLGSGLSLVNNSFANFVPRIIFSNDKTINFTKFQLWVSFLILVLSFFSLLVYNLLFSDFLSNLELFGFLFILIGLFFNGLTVNYVSLFIHSSKFRDLGVVGLFSCFVYLIVFICFVIFDSYVGLFVSNFIGYFIYYIMLKWRIGKIDLSYNIL